MPVSASCRVGPGRRHAGVTLVEMLVALAVFAMLGSLSYRAVAQMSALDMRLRSDHARWRDLEYAAHRIDEDLLRLAPAQQGIDTLRLGRTARGALQLLFGVGMTPGRPAATVTLSFSDGRLLRSTASATETLLDNVARVDWRFLHAGTWSAQWPPAGAAGDTRPDAIETRLHLPDLGLVTRVVALQ
ncbi:MAG: prepilin-type N-terminal cleavage/methylation domain-containing protein [Betaproteobacteria bacterium]|nr:MAG: prepilin-type N-terminal cleavage/methylation domain-containing protein [Betaproteobacteria bacterium]